MVYIDVLEAEAAAAGKKLAPPLTKKPKHWFSRFTMIARVMVILSGILAVVGFTQLPNPGDAQPPSKQSSQLRLAAALILFLVILLNVSLCRSYLVKMKLSCAFLAVASVCVSLHKCVCIPHVADAHPAGFTSSPSDYTIKDQ